MTRRRSGIIAAKHTRGGGKMLVIKCTGQDIHTLAVLNKRLIEDEKSDNPMSPEELENRMKACRTDEYNALLFQRGGSVDRVRFDQAYLLASLPAAVLYRQGIPAETLWRKSIS